MEDVTIKKLKEQHINNYKNAILENIKNNTNVLIDEDLTSLVRKPPLDSMDLIKTKFLTLAKKNKIILDTDVLSGILDDYRNCLYDCLPSIRDVRMKVLCDRVNSIEFVKNTDIIKINKSSFNDINKQIKKIIKEQLILAFDNKLSKNIDKVFYGDVDNAKKDKIISEIIKYIKSTYQKQFLENVDIKILVKDATLINSVKEQAERYLFTLNNSRLLNDNLVGNNNENQS